MLLGLLEAWAAALLLACSPCIASEHQDGVSDGGFQMVVYGRQQPAR